MYNDLRIKLNEAQSLVGWYAIGEAIQLTRKIAQVVRDHHAKPDDEEICKALKATALQAADFLIRQGNSRRPETQNELRTILIAIELEV